MRGPGFFVALALGLLAAALAGEEPARPGTFALRASRRDVGARAASVVTGTLAVRALGDARVEVARVTSEGTWTGRGALDGLFLRTELKAGDAVVASATYVFTPDGVEVDEALDPVGDAPAFARIEGRGIRQGPRPAPPRTKRVIVVAGREVPVDAEVVTWRDPGGFDAYLRTCAFRPDRALPSAPSAGCDTPERYAARSIAGPDGAPLTPEQVAAHVRQFVIHYDVCHTSRDCFRVLHDQRGLSVHFCLDTDGTIYQTLDLAERARHAGGANDLSIGVEIAHPGPLELTRDLAERYRRDDVGTYFDLGPRTAHVRTPDFRPRPARPEPIAGTIHGVRYTQWDFTHQQYEALAALVVSLRRALPHLKLEAPRDAQGRVRTDAFTPDELQAWSGLLGHWHVTKSKQDPGPAFDWERLLGRAAELERR